MLIVLSAEHKQDVAVLAALSVDFFAEFCKLAVEFVQKGNERGRKLFAGAHLALALGRRARPSRCLSCIKFLQLIP